MNTSRAGYREIEHTADWALKVWANDFPQLLSLAVVGMYELAGTKFGEPSLNNRQIQVDGIDRESFLVNFMTELLYLGEDEGMAGTIEGLTEKENVLLVGISVRPILSQEKEIKAVTFHNLEIETTMNGLTVTIVFDV